MFGWPWERETGSFERRCLGKDFEKCLQLLILGPCQSSFSGIGEFGILFNQLGIILLGLLEFSETFQRIGQPKDGSSLQHRRLGKF